MATKGAIFTTMVRSGTDTYYVDVLEKQDGSRYLLISQHSAEKEVGKKRWDVAKIRVMGETADQFRQAITEASALVGGKR